MKNVTWLFLLSVCLSLSAAGKDGGGQERQVDIRHFLIDPSKPFVHLEMDRIGPREPLRDGEPNEGIFVRLRNNCQLPIVVIELKTSAKESGTVIGMADEVVPTPPQPGGDQGIETVHHQAGQEGLTSIFLFPDMNEAAANAAVKEASNGSHGVDQKESATRPHGYNHGYQPGVQVLSVVPPGGAIAFSVPINHVSKTWHFEVPFRFAISSEGGIRQPYSYVAFFWEDLPQSYRAAHSGSSKVRSSEPLLHESGHVDPQKPQ